MSTLRESRPTYAPTIDLDRFRHNVDVIARLLPEGARLVAVLKADGYGHGAVELARRLTPDRVAMIAVALLEEALELRRAGIDAAAPRPWAADRASRSRSRSITTSRSA